MNNGVRIAAQEHADLVFLEDNLALIFWNSRRRRRLSRFGAGRIQFGGDATFIALRKELQCLTGGIRSLAGNLQL